MISANGSVTMDRATAIRAKNAAYDKLTQAHLACERKRHTFGYVPDAWLVRLAEMRREYEALAMSEREHYVT